MAIPILGSVSAGLRPARLTSHAASAAATAPTGPPRAGRDQARTGRPAGTSQAAVIVHAAPTERGRCHRSPAPAGPGKPAGPSNLAGLSSAAVPASRPAGQAGDRRQGSTGPGRAVKVRPGRATDLLFNPAADDYGQPLYPPVDDRSSQYPDDRVSQYPAADASGTLTREPRQDRQPDDPFTPPQQRLNTTEYASPLYNGPGAGPAARDSGPSTDARRRRAWPDDDPLGDTDARGRLASGDGRPATLPGRSRRTGHTAPQPAVPDRSGRAGRTGQTAPQPAVPERLERAGRTGQTAPQPVVADRPGRSGRTGQTAPQPAVPDRLERTGQQRRIGAGPGPAEISAPGRTSAPDRSAAPTG